MYRFFLQKNHAEDLVKGNVFISTLGECRKHEDPMRGDRHEGELTYHMPGRMTGGSDDKDFVTMAARGGVGIGPGCKNMTVGNLTRGYRLPDAFVLCTTNIYQPKSLGENFGGYCVEISKPTEFFHKVTSALRSKFPCESGSFGDVTYKDQVYFGLDDPPGLIGFVKRPDIYAYQKEFRFLWVPVSKNKIEPFLLECPEIIGMCRLIR